MPLGSDVLVEPRDRLCQASLARFKGLVLGGLVLLHLEAPLLAPLQLTPPEDQVPIALGQALAVLLQGGLRSLVGRETLGLQPVQLVSPLRQRALHRLTLSCDPPQELLSGSAFCLEGLE